MFSLILPRHVIRHQNYKLYLHEYNTATDKLIEGDCLFNPSNTHGYYVTNTLSGVDENTQSVVLEAVKCPGYFVYEEKDGTFSLKQGQSTPFNYIQSSLAFGVDGQAGTVLR